MRTELIPRFDNRKSFYHKAIVENIPSGTTLYSYEIPVCSIKNDKVKLYSQWDYSATTLRHVKEYLKQNNFKAESKSQIAKDYEL